MPRTPTTADVLPLFAETRLTVLLCPECGVPYAIPEGMRAASERAGKFLKKWYCPNGHHLGYGNNPVDEARAEAIAMRAEADQKGAHVRHLEARVEELTAEVESLRAKKRHIRKRKGEAPWHA
jgi:hypothetical protein